MKTLNIPLEDKEYEKLSKMKKDLSWHDFVMQLGAVEEKNEINKKEEDTDEKKLSTLRNADRSPKRK